MPSSVSSPDGAYALRHVFAQRLRRLHGHIHAAVIATPVQQVAQRQQRRRLARLPRRVQHEVPLVTHETEQVVEVHPVEWRDMVVVVGADGAFGVEEAHDRIVAAAPASAGGRTDPCFAGTIVPGPGEGHRRDASRSCAGATATGSFARSARHAAAGSLRGVRRAGNRAHLVRIRAVADQSSPFEPRPSAVKMPNTRRPAAAVVSARRSVNVVGRVFTGELTYKTPSGTVANELLYRHDEARLEVVAKGRPWSFDGDGALFRLVSEAQRIRLAHLFDPLLAVHTSVVDPLPHQITGVYEAMLPRASRCASSWPTTRAPARPSWPACSSRS